MGCNTTQNEVGGKDLFIKKCKAFNAASTNTSNDLVITAHGAKVGDLVKFTGSVGANTVVTTTPYYFVKTVVDANTIEISATPGGAAIVFDDTEAVMPVDVFRNVGGIRGKSAAFSSEGIDITNQDSDQWQTLLDGAGIRSSEISGDGVFTNEAVAKEIEDDFLANSLTCLAIVEGKSGRVYVGCYKLTSYEIGGAYDGEGTMSLSGSSSGPVTAFRAA